MADTIELARCLGSPLVNEGKPFELRESEELLDLAFENGVELIYLDNLKNEGKLSKLESAREELYLRRQKSQECIVRIATAMDELKIPYAITKTLRPYPGTPNDTDMLYLGALNKYAESVKAFESKGFEITGKGIQMQTELFDPQGGEIFDKDKRGGRFYIDFYRKLAADYVPYMDSERLMKRVISSKVLDYDVKVFDPIAEMTILYLHSVIMHRTFPLEVFWSTAYWLSEMDDNQIKEFSAYIRSHHAILSSRTAFTLMSELYERAYGEVPEKVEKMLILLGGERKIERKEYRETGLYSPHITRYSTWAFSVFEKIQEWNSMKGFLKELFMMLNPLFFIEVFHHMFSRKQIKKHSGHV